MYERELRHRPCRDGQIVIDHESSRLDLLFENSLSLFWNYPASRKDLLSKKKKKQKQKSDEKFSTVSCQFPLKTNEQLPYL